MVSSLANSVVFFNFFFLLIPSSLAFYTPSRPLQLLQIEPNNKIPLIITQTDLKLSPKEEQDKLIRSERGKRSSVAGDRVVELKQPLGLVLDEDELGNVFVETVAPLGNAARSGVVKKGDFVVMCSATFGDQLWSCRGVGLGRVLSAIKIRRGPVTMVFENAKERRGVVDSSGRVSKAQDDARLKAQEKKDRLMQELEEDEKDLKKGFFGLW